MPNYVQSCSVHPPVSINDHCTVGIKLKMNLDNEEAYYQHIWLYKDGDYHGFKRAL